MEEIKEIREIEPEIKEVEESSEDEEDSEEEESGDSEESKLEEEVLEEKSFSEPVVRTIEPPVRAVEPVANRVESVPDTGSERREFSYENQGESSSQTSGGGNYDGEVYQPAERAVRPTNVLADVNRDRVVQGNLAPRQDGVIRPVVAKEEHAVQQDEESKYRHESETIDRGKIERRRGQ